MITVLPVQVLHDNVVAASLQGCKRPLKSQVYKAARGHPSPKSTRLHKGTQVPKVAASLQGCKRALKSQVNKAPQGTQVPKLLYKALKPGEPTGKANNPPKASQGSQVPKLLYKTMRSNHCKPRSTVKHAHPHTSRKA